MTLATLLGAVRFPIANAPTWNPGPTKVPMGESLTSDVRLRFVDAAPAVGTRLKTDPLLKFVKTTSSNNWVPGEAVVYDANNNSIYDSTDQVAAGIPSVGSTLNPDSHFAFVDINSNTKWDPGETVVYDADGDGVYTSGDQIVAGTPPQTGATLTRDLNSTDLSSRIKYVQTGTNTTWVKGETVVYDSNNNGHYDNSTADPRIMFYDANSNGKWDSGEWVVYNDPTEGFYDGDEPVIAGTPPPCTNPTGCFPLTADPKLKAVDSNLDGHWELGKAVVYDTNNNGVLDAGESIVAYANPANQTALNSDSRIKYVQTGTNTTWVKGETVVYDSNLNGVYDNSSDPHIMYFESNVTETQWDQGDPVVYDSDNSGIFDCGGVDKLIAGALTCGFDVTLSPDPHFRFVDAKRTGKWVSGDTVVYDSNLDNVYESTEPLVAGAAPPNGTVLKEPVIAGTVPAIGTSLRSDPLLKFVDSSKSGFWTPGEAVVYDRDANKLYDTGEPLIVGISPAVGTKLSEPVIAGLAPANGALLAIDAKIKFIDLAKTGLWRLGEMAIYDSNNSGAYAPTDPVIAYGAQPNGVWDGTDLSGEVVVYDNNNSGLYTSADPVILGSSPPNGTALASDPRIKYVETGSDNHWDLGEMVVYDRNNDGVEDTGDSAITGQLSSTTHPLEPSAASDSLGRVWLVWNEAPAGSPNKAVYLKTWNGTSWTARQIVTNNPTPNFDNFLTPLANKTMMVLWSSNRTGHPQLFYRLYNAGGNPTPTTSDLTLTSSTMFDQAPAAVQDKYGRIWVAWARHNATRTFFAIYYKYYNGTTWSPDFQLGPSIGAGLGAKSPAITETKDGRIWIAWISNQTGAQLLYYTSIDDTSQFLPLGGVPDASWVRCSSLPCLFPFESPTPAYDDDRPSLFQTSDGVFEIFYDRSFPCGGGCTTPELNVMYTNFTYTSNWNVNAGPTPSSFMNTITGPPDYYPSAGQMSDLVCPGSNHGVCGRVWVFWNRLNTQTAAFDLLYANTGGIQVQNDVGIRSVVSNTTVSQYVPYNSTLRVNATISNYGNNPETALLTLKLNSTVLFSNSFNLGVNQTLVVNATYQTLAWGRGFYLIASLQCSCVEDNSVLLGDDTLSTSIKAVLDFPGDVVGDNGPALDGNVNILDIADIAFAFGSSCGQPRYHARDDINHDCKVNIIDVATAAIHFGKSV